MLTLTAGFAIIDESSLCSNGFLFMKYCGAQAFLVLSRSLVQKHPSTWKTGMWSSDYHYFLPGTISFAQGSKLLHRCQKPFLLEEVVGSDNRFSLRRKLRKPIEKLRMHNLFSSVCQYHMFCSKIHNFFGLRNPQLRRRPNILFVNLPSKGHLRALWVIHNWIARLLHLYQTITVLHQLHSLRLMHGMEYLTSYSLIGEQLEYIEKQMITHIIQKVANQC